MQTIGEFGDRSNSITTNTLTLDPLFVLDCDVLALHGERAGRLKAA
jgi:hypothetical protein